MNLFSSAPFIRILPAFILGVVLSFKGIGSVDFFIILLLLVLLLFIIWIRTSYNQQYKFRSVSPILLLLSFTCIGWLLNSFKEISIEKLNGFSVKCDLIIAESVSIPSQVGKMQRVEVMVHSYHDSMSWKSANFKAYFYYNDSFSRNVNVGDIILFPNQLKEIDGPVNPGQFDFRYYASLKRIKYQCRLMKDNWRVLHYNTDFSILQSSKLLRDRLLESFHLAGIVGQEYAVLSALVLGYDDEINKDIMDAFKASGTLHILSVSGMHVGIVFTALAFLFKKMENKKVWWLVRLIAMILIIWFYAILTGLSPSVIRSAMMFTFILVGKSMNRNSNIYNTLAASILVICISFDPLLLFEPGFQLSYMAVAGIAFIYPPISRWFYFRNKMVASIWGLIAVSLAAQLATFPISLFYFHQFPNYFIPANLLIIPVSTIAIFGGLALFFISPFHWLLLKSGYCMSKLIWFLNYLAIQIKHLPFAVSEDLYLSFSEMIVLDLLIFCVIYYFLEKSIRHLRVAIVLTILFVSLKSITAVRTNNRQKTIVYVTKKRPVYEIISGRKTVLYYFKQDSVSARKYSDDLHALYRLNRKERIEFDLTDTLNLVYGKYLVVGKEVFDVNP